MCIIDYWSVVMTKMDCIWDPL